MSYYYQYDNGGRRGFLADVPPVTRNLVVINCIIFLATLLDGNSALTRNFALFYPSSPFFRWWQPVTHMFMHGGFWHVFFNMYTLFLFGSVIERIVGSRKFIVYYFICGLGAAALHMGVQYLEMMSYMNGAALGNAAALHNISAIRMTPTVGASGAIYGVLIAYAMLFPESRMTLLFPPITLSAKWMVVAFAVIELFTGVTGTMSGIAHFAHLGGMLIGWLMMIMWRKRNVLFDKNIWI